MTELLILFVGAACIAVQVVLHRRATRQLDTALATSLAAADARHAEAEAKQEEVRELMIVVKDWANIARSARNDATDTLGRLDKKMEAHSDKVDSSLAEVPEKTAVKVVEKMRDGGAT